MIRAIVISYTEKGGQLNDRITGRLREEGDVAYSFRYGAELRDTGKLLEAEWRRTGAFIFIGAAGIAVRHIAPFLTDKTRDPAVLVADECGRYVIPVLSGHIGGGVALARRVADALGAEAVITTATDLNGKFAVDVFAVHNHLLLCDTGAIKKISSVILKGRKVAIHTDIPIEGAAPEGVCVAGDCPEGDSAEQNSFGRADGARRQGESGKVTVTCQGEILCELFPRPYVVGIGCKKGKSADALWDFLMRVCAERRIDMARIAAVASIDRKKEEAGIWELSERLGVPYEVYTARELGQVTDRVHSSAFVEQTVGVDNVCERSALRLAGEYGENCGLAVEKHTCDGMTVAVAEYRPRSYCWHTPQRPEGGD